MLYGFEKVSRGVSGLNLFRILGTKCWFNSPGSNGPKQTLCAKNPINIPKFRRENFINAFIDGFSVRSETKGSKIRNSKILKMNRKLKKILYRIICIDWQFYRPN